MVGLEREFKRCAILTHTHLKSCSEKEGGTLHGQTSGEST